MAKMFTYTVVLIGTLLLMAFAGIPGSQTSNLLQAIGVSLADMDLSSFKDGELFTEAFTIFTLVSTAGAVIIGTFTRQSTSEILKAGFVGLVGGWIIADFASIVLAFNGLYPDGDPFRFLFYIVTGILLPLAAGFVIIAIQWWTGADS